MCTGFIPADTFNTSGWLYETITFYEDRNFQGKSHECSGDNADLHSYFARCNSIRVENGCWVIYERSNYMGHQYYLKKGDYPEYQSWLGLNDSIRSCHSIPNHRGFYRIRLYDREDFHGQMKEYVTDCSNIYESFHVHDVLSCNVLEGYWIIFEETGFKGNQYFLRPGEYRRYSSWGAANSRVGSLKKIMDFY
ncbi:gamma-crystallin 2-like isoform X2 [Hyperolius riggenbachi]|uniref:gamma-crystallin 2-like isoform X2 n=1 Tax=Hyperolius riggenbachi TaxID=752182 RepID=UPI0035A29EB8